MVSKDKDNNIKEAADVVLEDLNFNAPGEDNLSIPCKVPMGPHLPKVVRKIQHDQNVSKQNLEVDYDFEYDPEAFTSKFLEDPTGTVDSFLTKISTPSKFHSSAPEIASSIVAELQNELQSIVISNNVIELLQQGQDPTVQITLYK